MVLQGSASVYSKKIDFLWMLVEKMTEILRNKITENEEIENGLGSVRGRRKKIDMPREFEYLNIDIGKNINMSGEEEMETVMERMKKKLNFF